MKRILVAVDGSVAAPRIIQAAVDFAKSYDAKITLFRAVSVPDDFPAEAYSTTPGDLVRLLEARAEDELESLASAIPIERREGIAVAAGPAWQEICSHAREHRFDLVFVGTRARDASRPALGSTAAKVVLHADRPVLVHRPIIEPMIAEPHPVQASLGYELF